MLCSKRKFKTEKEAELAIAYIKKVKKKYKRPKHPIRHYYCEYCRHYHLTSQEANVEPVELLYTNKFRELIKKS